MKNVLLWIIYFIPALIVELFCYLTNPIAALFTYRELRKDWVKRLGKTTSMYREYLYLYWWQTHDNAVDEWWYGTFNNTHWFKFAREWTQEDYDNSWWVRYYCRVMWMYRNNAYGWLYNLFSRKKETPSKVYNYGTEYKGFWYELIICPSSFHLKIHLPVFPGRYMSINIGWKAHKLTERLLYANRIIGPIRKYE